MAGFTVAAGVARGLLDYAVSRGVDQTELLGRAGLDLDVLDDPDARIGSETYVRLMRAGQALTADPALALHWAEDVNLARMSIVGLLGEASTTLLESFMQVRRYGRLVTDLDEADERFDMVPDPDGCVWSVDRRRDPNAFPELTETTFGFMVCGSRVAAPSTWLKAVHVTHPAPPYAAEYERVFGVPVTFDSHWNALKSDPAFLTTPVNVQPRYVFGVLSKHADALMQGLRSASTLRGRVENLILPILHTGEVGIDAVADGLGLSRQTLYRRLKAEDATFEQVLDALRHRLALDYLLGGRVSVNETAFLVGFSDAAAFSRAFKRWTGQTPREARQTARDA
ncbi:MAG: AraC family transcriptional regulator ligand-binding domain-containing protein [Caulobacterales bacterium]|nr:AraC family transcriptional regulator ligand-binding domain-containing protein [Caulobacterales bacterium]